MSLREERFTINRCSFQCLGMFLIFLIMLFVGKQVRMGKNRQKWERTGKNRKNKGCRDITIKSSHHLPLVTFNEVIKNTEKEYLFHFPDV